MKDKRKSSGVGGRASVSANVSIKLFDKDGKVKDKREIRNLIVDAGFDAAIQQILGLSGVQPTEFNYVAVGTGTTAANASDTALETEIGSRVQDTVPDFTSPGQGDLIVTFAAGNGTGSLTESGVLNASSGGTLLARTTFTAITKGASDALQITWQFTLS